MGFKFLIHICGFVVWIICWGGFDVCCFDYYCEVFTLSYSLDVCCLIVFTLLNFAVWIGLLTLCFVACFMLCLRLRVGLCLTVCSDLLRL